MPVSPPPTQYTGSPTRFAVPDGTALWRTHLGSYESNEFNVRMADSHFGGGQFDATNDDKYPYLYVASSPRAVLAEFVRHSLPPGDSLPSERVLPRAALRERRLSPLTLTADLTLLSLLTAEDRGAVGQDEWLINAGPASYAYTRRWGHWLRQQAPWAQGIIWPSAEDPEGRLIVLFGDRMSPDTLQRAPAGSVYLDSTEGADYLTTALAPWNVHISRPRPDGSLTGVPSGPPPDVADRPEQRAADFDDFFRGAYAQVRRVAWVVVRDWGLAEDVTQEAMVLAERAWEEELAEHPNPLAWTMLTAKRIAFRAMGKIRRSAVPDSPAVDQYATDARFLDFLDEDAATRMDIESALKQLPHRQAESFVLADVCRFSMKEAAQLLGIAEGTFKRHLHEARRNLRDMLSPGDDDGETDDQ